MMVIVKRMEMPDSCIDCRLCRNDLGSDGTIYAECDAAEKTIIECQYGESEDVWQKLHSGRQSWCPLIEVPTPHGDLIDRDKLEIHDGWLREAEEQRTHITFAYEHDIERASAIIPADRGQ